MPDSGFANWILLNSTLLYNLDWAIINHSNPCPRSLGPCTELQYIKEKLAVFHTNFNLSPFIDMLMLVSQIRNDQMTRINTATNHANISMKVLLIHLLVLQVIVKLLQ